MTKICATFLLALFAVETVSVYATADQNVFASRDPQRSDDDAVRTTPQEEAPEAPAATKSTFNVSTGGSIGRGRGGDRLLDINSTSKMSFFPRDLALSTVLVERMNKFLGACVSQAAKDAGIGNVSDINVSHMGGYVDRRINNGSQRRNRSWSLHSTGRALDIGRIDVVAGGKTYRIPMTKASHDGRNGREESRFYKSFVKCWGDNNKNNCGSRSVLDCKYNSLHHDHVHIAIPFCPRKPGIAST